MKLFEDVLVGVAVKFFAGKKSFSLFLYSPITKYNVHRLGIAAVDITLNAELMNLTKRIKVKYISKTCENALKLSINRL